MTLNSDTLASSTSWMLGLQEGHSGLYSAGGGTKGLMHAKQTRMFSGCLLLHLVIYVHVCVHVHACICVCLCMWAGPLHLCGNQSTSLRDLFSLSSVWVLEIKLISSGLAADILTHWANLWSISFKLYSTLSSIIKHHLEPSHLKRELSLFLFFCFVSCLLDKARVIWEEEPQLRKRLHLDCL